eukprot:CAMPEP_0197547064 /NCGR_PEP_ID=MMETSP1320-20131121/1501_1 /TAXON_ID=91990 /ORGANISM="Bolidomonas sp., Strain RCC2347" /LENGTH=520 /DNA_ID=CAMNT_0043106761 /DNA_START=294 /DNA_END=1853 /DNA_ORIENTATION=-
MDIAREVMTDSLAYDWNFIATKRDVSIFSRSSQSDVSVQQVKAVTLMNSGLEAILAHLTNPNRRRGKKDAVFESKLIEDDPDSKTQVLYRAQKMPWPLKVRDFVLEQQGDKEDERDGDMGCVVYNTPRLPAAGGQDPGILQEQLVDNEPIHSFKSNVTYLAQVDLQGSIPTKIKNKFMTQEAMWVADVSRYFLRQNLRSEAGGAGDDAAKKRGSTGSGGSGSGSGFGLWRGLRRRSSSSGSSKKKGADGGGSRSTDGSATVPSHTSGGSSQEYGWKPMSKNSREYFQEIVNTEDGSGRGGSMAQHDSHGSGGSREKGGSSQEYKWKKLQRSSREYFKDLFGYRRGSREFDPSDYERTPPASPATGKNGRDVVEASLSLPKLARRPSVNEGSGGSREYKGGSREFKRRLSDGEVGVRNLVPISPANSRSGSMDFGSGSGRFSRHNSRSSFTYDNPKSDISAGGQSTHSNHSGGAKSSGSRGSRTYGGENSGECSGSEMRGRKLEPLKSPRGEGISPIKFGR